MIPERMQELTIFLLLEGKPESIQEYIENNYDVSKINKRYEELLDDFLNEYALNTTEKSD